MSYDWRPKAERKARKRLVEAKKELEAARRGLHLLDGWYAEQARRRIDYLEDLTRRIKDHLAGNWCNKCDCPVCFPIAPPSRHEADDYEREEYEEGLGATLHSFRLCEEFPWAAPCHRPTGKNDDR